MLLWRGAPAVRRSLMAALLLGSLGGCGVAGDPGAVQSALVAGERVQDPDARLYPKGSHPFGASLESWSERWWSWAYSMPAASNPNTDVTVDCDRGQDGPVFFLPELFGGQNVTRSCTVSRHKAIAVSIVSLLNDYPCPDPTFQPAPGQTLFDFLSKGAAQAQAADVQSVSASIDGVEMKDAAAHHVASDDLFYFTADTSLQSIDGCITGTRQPAVADSYFYMLKPLAPGSHTLVSRYVSTAGQTFVWTTNLDVRGDD
jgi:hypothetical protein